LPPTDRESTQTGGTAVFFIAKPEWLSSIQPMILRHLMAALIALLALTATSCCCLF
jgi:hypothetical protein